MATKNQRAQNIWITDAIEITEPMKAKQNCLANGPQDRVGINKESRKALQMLDFTPMISLFDSKCETGNTLFIPRLQVVCGK